MLLFYYLKKKKVNLYLNLIYPFTLMQSQWKTQLTQNSSSSHLPLQRTEDWDFH